MNKLIEGLTLNGRYNSHDMAGTIFGTLEYKLAMTSAPVMSCSRSGECLKMPNVDEMAKVLSPDAKLTFSSFDNHGGSDFVYSSDDSVCYFDISQRAGGRFMIGVNMVGQPERVRALEQMVSSIVEAVQVKKGVVRTLMRRPHGLDIGTLGVAGIPLLRENYEQATIAAFDHVVVDLTNPTPCGKLIILDGPPGTGKTFLVRALIEHVSAEFVFVPPNIVSELAGPDIITTLADERACDDTRPIVLIVEDADQCLQERATDNLGSISNLLNMTDGIAGAALDIRVVATTNMDIKRMPQDKALLRDGRLCKRMDVGELSAAKALEVAARLGITDAVSRHENHKPADLPRTLASLYKLARDEKEAHAEPLVTTKSTKVGFTR